MNAITFIWVPKKKNYHEDAFVSSQMTKTARNLFRDFKFSYYLSNGEEFY